MISEVLLLPKYGVPVIIDHDIVLVYHVHAEHHVGACHLPIIIYLRNKSEVFPVFYLTQKLLVRTCRGQYMLHLTRLYLYARLDGINIIVKHLVEVKIPEHRFIVEDNQIVGNFKDLLSLMIYHEPNHEFSTQRLYKINIVISLIFNINTCIFTSSFARLLV